MFPSDPLSVLVQLDMKRVQDLAKQMAFHLADDATRAETQAAALMIYMGTMPRSKLQNAEINQEFLSLASRELVTIATALYGTHEDT